MNLLDIIISQRDSSIYSSIDYTHKQKYSIYQAFINVYNKHPQEMENYLLNNSRSGGFQCKIFQEFISILESNIPYSFKSNSKFYKVESLLDCNLNLFDGISEFEGVINDRLTIKNNTQELYISGNTGAITEKFYIGKLLSIFDLNKKSFMKHVTKYSFSKIVMKDIKPQTVIVTHLRTWPHYQMGGMAHLNRIRKKIVDEAKKAC